MIDDVVPNSYAASLSDLSTSELLKARLGDRDASWMGDVYRIVFFIEAFFQQYQYATVTDNHGQLIVWREPRQLTEIRRRGVEQIARMPFESVVIGSESFRLRSYADILDRLRQRVRGMSNAAIRPV